MELLHRILDVLNDIATNIPLDAIIAALVISPVVLGLKKLLKIDNLDPKLKEKLMFGIAVLICGLAVGIEYIAQTPTDSPYIIPIRTAVLFLFTQPVYLLLLKPLIRKIQSYVENAVQYNLDKMTATEPAAGVTLNTVTDAEIETILQPEGTIMQKPKAPVTIQDFSSRS